MTVDSLMQRHFRSLAPDYNALRTTDPEPVESIRLELGNRAALRCADIGCGSGRYSLLLLRALPGMHLTCIDTSSDMLREANRYLARHGITTTRMQQQDASRFTASEGAFDCIVTFNAIHHFDPLAFLARARDTLAPGGRVVIYTRLPEQNADTIWGRYFPEFTRRETRLYDRERIETWRERLGATATMRMEYFDYPRRAPLRQLVELARRRHYSTFEFYREPELRRAIGIFERRLRRAFADPERIEWHDGNALAVFQTAA